MAQIRLINNTGKLSILGKLIKYNPTNPKGFVYASKNDQAIGKVARVVANNVLCLITLISIGSNNPLVAVTNLDGGNPGSIYGGSIIINAGGVK